jgi:hypothetical protein
MAKGRFITGEAWVFIEVAVREWRADVDDSTIVVVSFFFRDGVGETFCVSVA